MLDPFALCFLLLSETYEISLEKRKGASGLSVPEVQSTVARLCCFVLVVAQGVLEATCSLHGSQEAGRDS